MKKFEFDGSTKLDVKCPNCGHVVTKSVAELRTDDQFNCPGCEVVFAPEAVDATFTAVEKELNQFRRDLRRMFK